MEEGRVYTDHLPKVRECCFWKVLARTARARVSLRVVAARAPPGAPTLASHGPNVRCKKTYRATQRTNRNIPRPSHCRPKIL